MFSFTILDFQKFEIFTDDPLQGPIYVTMPNFIKIGRKVAEIWRYKSLPVFYWRTAAILDLLGAYWDHPR